MLDVVKGKVQFRTSALQVPAPVAQMGSITPTLVVVLAVVVVVGVGCLVQIEPRMFALIQSRPAATREYTPVWKYGRDCGSAWHQLSGMRNRLRTPTSV